MQFETVGRVAVRDLGFEIGREIDNVDSSKWTFLRTDTASDAEAFRNEGDLGFRGHFDTELAGAHHRAGLLALLTTFLYVS